MSDKDAKAAMAEEVALFPDLTYYYGLGFEELCRMPNWALTLYARALDRLQAAEESMYARAVAFPHLKKSARQRYADLLSRRQRAGARVPARRIPTGDLEGVLASVGIGFARESAHG